MRTDLRLSVLRCMLVATMSCAHLSFPGSAHADDGDGASSGPDINAMFDRASRRAARGDLQSALRGFKEIVPHAPWWSDVAWNVGNLAEETSAWADCAFYFRRYLILEPEDPERRRLEQRIERCEARIVGAARLHVRVPALRDARIAINGIEMGTGDATAVLAPGPVTIEVTRIDHEPFAQRLELGADAQEEVVVELEGITYFGTLSVEMTPPGGTVRIDDGPTVTATQDAPLRLPVGRYLVQIEREGYHPWQRFVDVGRERNTLVDATLLDARIPLDEL